MVNDREIAGGRFTSCNQQSRMGQRSFLTFRKKRTGHDRGHRILTLIPLMSRLEAAQGTNNSLELIFLCTYLKLGYSN